MISNAYLVLLLQAFVRHSSVRSSLASARNGLNRYFVSRAAHITAESLSQHTPLPNLGALQSSPKSSHVSEARDSPLALEDDIESIIPPITCVYAIHALIEF